MNPVLLRSVCLVLVLAATTIPDAGAEELLARTPDAGVEDLLEGVAKSTERFERALDGKFKKSVLRGPSGEVDVGNFLNDLESSIERARKRFDDDYSASDEIRDLLERASRLHGYLRDNPGTKGADEWDAVARRLGQLATAYGATFPLADGAVVRRIGDKELIEAAEGLGKFAGSFDKAVGKAAGQAKKQSPDLAARLDTVRDDLDAIEDSAKALRSRLKSGKHASAEARRLGQIVDRVDAALAQTGVAADLVGSWQSGSALFDKIAQAFALERSGAAAAATN